MRITIVCNDTRGGVEPYTHLAVGLRRSGFEVRAVAPRDLAHLFGRFDVPVQPLSGDLIGTVAAAGSAVDRGSLQAMRLAAGAAAPVAATWLREALAGCEGADLVVGGVGGMGIGVPVADALGVPFLEAHLQPIGAPTATYPPVLLPWVPTWLPSGVVRASHRVGEAALRAMLDAPMRAARREVFGRAPTRPPRPTSKPSPVLYGFSPHVVRVPTVDDRPRHTTGYWTGQAPSSPTIDARLARFLADATGPVATIGFGSMPAHDPPALALAVVGAARDAGLRVVLVSGWTGLDTVAADDVHVVREVDHASLLPRVDVVVHHGGAGTTGAGLRAGVPSVVVPFTMDQPFWAGRVAAIGAGPPPIPRRRLTRSRLAAALHAAVNDPSMRRRAAEIGRRLRAEDGVGEAVRLIAEAASATRPRP